MMETTRIIDVSLESKRHITKNYTSFRDYIESKHGFLLIKRVFDVFASLMVILLVFSWLFPIIYLLIKMDSKGPVFFVQKRVGFLGRSFPCFKFRTMYVNSEANTKQATENDPRITRMGSFLRNSSLDEVPQFINVLLGHMSIIGPRPHMYKDCHNFSRVVESYKFRNLMKPGISGLAQVKGYRGPAQDFDKIFRRYQWDAFYVRNAGIWLDLRIMHKTASQMIGYLFRKFFVLDSRSEQNMPVVTEWNKPVKNLLN